MRISHRFRFVFLSNPKCGSTTIRKILDKFTDLGDSPDKPPPYHPHTKAQEIQELFQEEGWDLSKYWVFTTIRNPWSRMVSYYHYGRWDLNFRPFWDKLHDEESALKISFRDWIINWAEWQAPNWMFDRQPLEKFCCDEKGNLLVNQIIPIEKIDQELPLLLDRLGIPLTKSKNDSIQHVNMTQYNPRQEYYDEETKSIVAEIFREDIRFGAYTFDDYNSQ